MRGEIMTYENKSKREIINIQVSRSIHYARIAAVGKLGGKCKRCGFEDMRALQIDHILGRGNEDRRNKMVGYKLYLEIIRNPLAKEKYQILCANCNWIKKYENKETLNGVRHNDYEEK